MVYIFQTLEGQTPVAKIDATANPDLAREYDVKGYPTIKILKDGKPIAYDGSRTEEGIKIHSIFC